MRISTEDAAVEIFVLDGDLQVAARGIGSVRAELPEGIYKIKLRAGLDAQEDLVVHRRPRTEKAYPPLSFPSPAPLAVTREHSAEHADAARRESRRVHARLGAGASIFVFARDWQGEGGAPTAGDPAAGLRVEQAAGNALVDVSRQSARGDAAAGAWAGCTIAVDPGLYRLVMTLPSGEAFVQSIAAARGWQTQLFLLRRAEPSRAPADARAEAAGPATPAILMAGDPGFDPDRRDDRLTELARQALVDRRPVLSRQLREMLKLKVERPMLGIFAGHLLLQEAAPDLDLVRTVVGNLRAILTSPHPDVEALAVAAGLDTAFRFANPPMLRQSWTSIVQATPRLPHLVPAGSPASEIYLRLTDREPWLVWRRSTSDDEQQDLADAFVDVLKQLVGRRGGLVSAATSLAEKAKHELAASPGELLRRLTRAVDSIVDDTDARPARPTPAPSAGRRASALVPEPVMELLVSRLGIPRSSVESMIDGGIKRLKQLGEG